MENKNGETYIHKFSAAGTNQMASRGAATFADFFLPYLEPGMTLLDCGCGPGTVSLDLAEHLSPGEVVGIDNWDQQIDLAKKNALERGIGNAQFMVANAYSLPFENESFDRVFSGALLEHLSDPVSAVREMYRVLKPNGVVGVWGPDSQTRIFGPKNEDIELVWQRFMRYRFHCGGNPNVGREFRRILREGGFEKNVGMAKAATHGTNERILRAEDWIQDEWLGPNLRRVAVEEGWATDKDFLREEKALRAWCRDPDAFTAVLRIRAIGWKE